ncbi:ABC transporter permease EcsB [Staphylococcus pasteuri]|uniref:ABC transporter permease EcsB n=1 Tax=Staphylococcus pasteuri TaxID=45972 RepID=UPI001F3210A8|nr:ABC transporter permease [Staphylococcus pasteuri]MCF7599461.1 ABC transporter permease [Staphylococcus pasteuri]
MINEATTLFRKRQKAIRKEKNYYNKFIFNGHFTVFLLILFGAFIMGYGEWLKHIPQHIDYALITSIIIALLSLFPLRTLLKEADQIFLLPFEKYMKRYMILSINYSYFTRIMMLLLILIVPFPLFYQLSESNIQYYIAFALVALITPYLVLHLRWCLYQLGVSTWIINVSFFIILSLNFYIILGLHSYLGILITIAMAVLIVVLKGKVVKQLYPWERMIAIEQRHHTNYYKFVNMFTDVKHLRETAVRRSYLDFILPVPKGKKFNANQMYLYLFMRSFVRGRDAFSIIIRLMLIAVVLIIWLSHPIVGILIGSLFMYITLLQMSQFYTQQAYGLWPQVWPAPDTIVIKGYEKFLYRLMIVMGVVFTIAFSIMNPTLFFFSIVFFLVGYLTIRSTIKKLKYQETLLRD